MKNDKDDMFNCYERGTFLSPRRKSNPWPPRYWLCALTTELRETPGELGNFSKFKCDARPAYCNFESVFIVLL